MGWGLMFFVLAIVAALFRLSDLAVACGLVAIALGWRPVATRLHVGKTVHGLPGRPTGVAGWRARHRGAARFKPISKEAIERIVAHGAEPSRSAALEPPPKLRATGVGRGAALPESRGPRG